MQIAKGEGQGMPVNANEAHFAHSSKKDLFHLDVLCFTDLQKQNMHSCLHGFFGQ